MSTWSQPAGASSLACRNPDPPISSGRRPLSMNGRCNVLSDAQSQQQGNAAERQERQWTLVHDAPSRYPESPRLHRAGARCSSIPLGHGKAIQRPQQWSAEEQRSSHGTTGLLQRSVHALPAPPSGEGLDTSYTGATSEEGSSALQACLAASRRMGRTAAVGSGCSCSTSEAIEIKRYRMVRIRTINHICFAFSHLKAPSKGFRNPSGGAFSRHKPSFFDSLWCVFAPIYRYLPRGGAPRRVSSVFLVNHLTTTEESS